MKSDFGYKNIMQAPRIEKVVISAGVGSFKDKKKITLIIMKMLNMIITLNTQVCPKKKWLIFQIKKSKTNKYIGNKNLNFVY